VLGDVGEPQSVGFGASEVAIHEIRRSRCFRDLPVLRPARKTSETETAHHELDCATRHGHLPAEHELGMHTPSTVGLAGLGVDQADHLSDHLVANRSSRGLAVPPHVEP
jgi:hypothetical protein